MAENTQLSFDIRVGGNQDQALGSLKKQLREATQEVQALSDKFGSTSKEAIQAAKRAAELKDSIGDAKDLVSAFNPDAKFKALTGALQGVAGGFAAVQGAVGLFGKENEDLQKTLVKVQSAMAFSEGLNTVMGSIDAFKNLGAVIKNSVITAFTSLKAAISATGLGLIVVSIGLLAANFDKVKSAVLSLVPDLKQLVTFFGNIITKVTDFIGVTSQAERALASLEKTTKRGNEGIEARIKVLTAQGGKEKEIYELSKQQGENELNFLRAKLKTKEGLNEEELKKFRGLKTEQAVLDAQEQKRQNEAAKESANQRGEEAKRRLEESNKAKEARDKVAKEIEEENERRKEAEVKFFFDRIKAIDALNAQRAKEKAEQAALDKELLDQGAKEAEDFNNKEFAALQISIKNEKAAQEAKIKIAKEEAEQKIALAQQSAAALTALSDIVGKETAAGKTLAISAALINTYLGITAGVKLGFPAAIPAVAIAAATGFSAVKNIIATKVPGAASGGGGNMSAPSVSAAAPIAPPQPQAATTNLSSQTINAIGNQAVRAYVVENDVTSNQQRIAAIQQRARFG
jgi:chromosome segregation ATPase